jgi:cell division protein FtsL
MTAKGIKKKIMYILGGTVLTEDFFWKNARFIITVIVIIVLYISNRYSCIEKMSSIERLQRELKDAKYESVTISAELMGVSRESKVEDLVRKNEVDLKQANEPVYKVGK